jgi:hypothetical protein
MDLPPAGPFGWRPREFFEASEGAEGRPEVALPTR